MPTFKVFNIYCDRAETVCYITLNPLNNLSALANLHSRDNYIFFYRYSVTRSIFQIYIM